MQANSQILTSLRDFWNGGAPEKGASLAFSQVANTEDAAKDRSSAFVASFLSKSFGNLSISAHHLARPLPSKVNQDRAASPPSLLREHPGREAHCKQHPKAGA